MYGGGREGKVILTSIFFDKIRQSEGAELEIKSYECNTTHNPAAYMRPSSL